ncbi:MAG TPA: hypothetical protein VFY73_18840 [Ideonella sp.]|uniref:glycine-rich domain-containing protein n=1 Tax=Ideonella sp. TaxID=1929293 RepID=UPI002E31F80A|nr:hypothetical protein [Ideonella sp.]HEX5686088.1 hypothetical protein [Ideonella sp.]
MQLLSENRGLAQVMNRIAALDLAPIKFKITSKEDGYGWTAEHVDRIELGYKRFLALLAMHPGQQLAPTRDIDKFWHAHILDTRKYAADCELIFGGFLHHNPYLGMRGDEDRLDQAAQALHGLFESDFGEEVPANAHMAAVPADPAWCGGEHADKSTAWCGGEAPAAKAAAWCGGEAPVEKAAAWCGGEAPAAKAAAWCGGEAPIEKAAAWCGGEAPAAKAAAWCGGEAPAKKATAAAWCGGEAPTH